MRALRRSPQHIDAMKKGRTAPPRRVVRHLCISCINHILLFTAIVREPWICQPSSTQDSLAQTNPIQERQEDREDRRKTQKGIMIHPRELYQNLNKCRVLLAARPDRRTARPVQSLQGCAPGNRQGRVGLGVLDR